MGKSYNNMSDLSGSAQSQIHKRAVLAYAQNADSDGRDRRFAASQEYEAEVLSACQSVNRIYSNTAAASMLQIAEHNLYAVTANLSQMKRLVEKILSGRYDDEFIDNIVSEFAVLAEANIHLLNPAAADARNVERYPDEQPAVTWVSLEQITIQSDVLNEPEQTHRELVCAIENVASGLREIRQLLLDLQRQSEDIYKVLQRQCDCETLPERSGDAKAAAYRTSAKLIETAHAAHKSHTEAIAALAAKIKN